MNKTGLKGYVHAFSVDYNAIDTTYILDIHKYLMKTRQCKIMFGTIIKNFYWIIKLLHHRKSL